MTQSIKKQKDDIMRDKQQYFMGEQNYKEVVFEYNKKILERERQLKDMQKKITRERKAYHVERVKKANTFERQRMVEKLTFLDSRAKQVKEDRTDFMMSRKFMVQKLKKDLDNMKSGLITMNEIEKKYSYLHDDKEFLSMMQEIRGEIHPGTDLVT